MPDLTREALAELLAQPLTEAEAAELSSEDLHIPPLHVVARTLLLYGIAIVGAKNHTELERFVRYLRDGAHFPIFFGNYCTMYDALKDLRSKEMLRQLDDGSLEVTEAGLYPLQRFSLFLRRCVNRNDVRATLREFATPGIVKAELQQRLEKCTLRELILAEKHLKDLGK